MRLCAFVAFLALFLAASGSPQKPNIVVLFADDLGYGDINCFGSPNILSPNINKLAAGGMKFTSMYAGAPICSSSRSSLLTGRLPVRNGVYCDLPYPEDLAFRVFYPWSEGSLPKSEFTIAEMLKEQGYNTKLVGKWHLGHYNESLPTYRGFDEFFGLPYSQDEGCPPGYGMNCTHEWEHIWPGVPLYNGTKIIQQPVNLGTLVPRYNVEALSFIERSAAAKKPFFLYMAYDEVHVPLFTSPKFANMSQRGLFGDCVAEMDDSIGQIIAKLESLGIDENTLVIFTSDNGPWKDEGVNGGSSGPLRGQKGELFEGGIREPSIAYWPGTIAPGSVNQDIASQMDIIVTAAELSGGKLPTDRIYDGVSLLPALNGTGKVDRDFYWYYRDGTLFAVRYKQFKLHYYSQEGFGVLPRIRYDPPLLFNIEENIEEDIPLNLEDYPEAMKIIDAGVIAHQTAMKKGVAQFGHINIDIAPCCNHATECICGPW